MGDVLVAVAVWRLWGGVGCAEGLLGLVCMCAELVCRDAAVSVVCLPRFVVHSASMTAHGCGRRRLCL